MGVCMSSATPTEPVAPPPPVVKQQEEPETKQGTTEVKERREFPYELKELLGKGHFAKVRRCRHKQTGKEYAVKIIDKKDFVKNASVVKQEIEILRAIGKHTHIVGLEDYYEGEDEYYIVTELCRGGDLFTKIVQEGKYTEKRAVRACRQLAEALLFMHTHNVAHRDLKPENILLMDDSLDADIKVADFGLSKLMKSQQHLMRTVCGTWAYCAPEVISRKPYTKAVDNWTLGVLMFILLSGYHPFDVYGEMPEPELLKKIKACEYDFDDEVWDHVSPHAKNLIRGLLQLDPEKRISIEDYLKSPWILGEGVKDKPLKMVVERLSRFNDTRRKFRAIVLAKLVAGKFRASISRDHTPNHSISVHKMWTGSPGSPQELSRGDKSPVSQPMSPVMSKLQAVDSLPPLPLPHAVPDGDSPVMQTAADKAAQPPKPREPREEHKTPASKQDSVEPDG